MSDFDPCNNMLELICLLHGKKLVLTIFFISRIKISLGDTFFVCMKLLKNSW